MMLSGRFTFYDIDAIGYFRRGIDDPIFGNTASCLEQLRQWATSEDIVLRDTCTYEPDGRGDRLRTYCFDMVRSVRHGDFILTTWNEIPTIEGKTPTVDGRERVGSAHVELSDLPAGGIPGYPTYFWFIPSENRFATVTFDSILNGHQNLGLYLGGFLRTFSPHAVRRTNAEGGIDVTGYRQSSDDAPENLYPRFLSSLCQNRTAISFIKRNRQSITKYIRKMKVEPHITRDVGLLRQLFEHATNLDQDQRAPDPLKVRYEVDVTPSAADLNAMIQDWQRTHTTRWDDVGFKISGDDRNIRWLSHSLARSDFDLDIDGDTTPTVGAQALLNAIEAQRDTIKAIART